MEDWRDDGAAGTPVASQPQQKLGAPDLKLLAPTQPSGREIMPPILGWPSTEGPQLGASGLCMETPADWGGSAAVAQHPPQCGPFPLPRLPPSTHHDHLLGASPHHRTWTQVLASGSAFCDTYLREWHTPPPMLSPSSPRQDKLARLRSLRGPLQDPGLDLSLSFAFTCLGPKYTMFPPIILSSFFYLRFYLFI